MLSNSNELDISMDSQNLYKEETYTDQHAGSIRCLTPVNDMGETDLNRKTLYIGQTQLVTPMGALPLSFEIEASSLKEAIEKFSQHAKASLEKTMKEIQEMRREAASSIVIPEGGAGGMGGMPGAGGGGKIQFP